MLIYCMHELISDFRKAQRNFHASVLLSNSAHTQHHLAEALKGIFHCRMHSVQIKAFLIVQQQARKIESMTRD